LYLWIRLSKSYKPFCFADKFVGPDFFWVHFPVHGTTFRLEGRDAIDGEVDAGAGLVVPPEDVFLHVG
jgi:hypothetical protein